MVTSWNLSHNFYPNYKLAFLKMSMEKKQDPGQTLLNSTTQELASG